MKSDFQKVPTWSQPNFNDKGEEKEMLFIAVASRRGATEVDVPPLGLNLFPRSKQRRRT